MAVTPLLRIPPACEDGLHGTHPKALVVRIEMLNDDGERAVCIATSLTVDGAADLAERAAFNATGYDSYVMNDWQPV